MRLFLAALMTAIAAPTIAAPPSAEDRAALERVIAATDDAWNRRDAPALAATYASTGTLGGGASTDFLTGPDAIRAYFEKSLASRAEGMRHVSRLVAADVIAPGVAHTDTYVTIEQIKPDGSWKVLREFRNNSIAIREGGQWRLRTVRAHAQPARQKLGSLLEADEQAPIAITR